MLRKREGERTQDMTLPELETTASALIMAGSETTATSLAGITFLLLTHPRTLEKLVDEVRSSFESSHDIDMVSVQNLRYMSAVINEGLLIYPPVPTGIPRRVGEGGGVFLDRFAPENTLVQVWHWAVFHSPQNFALPDSFIPERWLDQDPRFANDKKDAFQPFSVGPRSCIGRNLALAEMRLILARIIWDFDLTLNQNSKDWLDNMETYILWQKNPLHCPPQLERSCFGDVTATATLKLPYLGAVIQETLRLLPPINGRGSHRISPGALVDGIYVPAGVMVSADPWSIGRSPRYWAEPHAFRPERWVPGEQDEGPWRTDVRSAWRPFMVGPRVCIGREMALQSIRLMVSKTLVEMDLEMVNKDFVWERDAANDYVWYNFDILVKCKPRVRG
ncbi:hypothetical protein PoMZ_09009 [Pyricularia oryzae]|uniref:Isotrichodermin C-15 hydroxylase n=1 Tax=Pyricularia oryzae TaxID=318829 RepID=A0A4P7MVS0_PYROR|nr:hypothetical protein PoMZ_09009 [Pyricularia oryzae]